LAFFSSLGGGEIPFFLILVKKYFKTSNREDAGTKIDDLSSPL